jgi:hypothetical protein
MVAINGKRVAAIATLAASLLMTGGASVASSTNDVEGGARITAGLVPGPVGQAGETAGNTVADVTNQIRRRRHEGGL